MAGPGLPRQDPPQVFGHPSGLFLVAATEMWERFSYYGMRALLVLFLTAPVAAGGFGWNNADALRLYGTYTALIWAMPLFGGWAGDRLLGPRNAVILGALLMSAGHLMMAGPALVPWAIEAVTDLPVHQLLVQSGSVQGQFELSNADAQSIVRTTLAAGLPETAVDTVLLTRTLVATSFYAALGLLVLGAGFYIANSAVIVGALYPPGDPRREGGFTIFYMAINVGALLPGFTVGTLGETLGWHYGFSAAAVGMFIGLVSFRLLASSLLGDVGLKRTAEARKEKRERLTAVDRKRLAAFFVLAIFAVIFWSGFEQWGGLLNLHAQDATDRVVLGFEVPTTWFQSLNPLYIILLTPVLAAFWTALAKRGLNPSAPLKVALALLLLGSGMLLMYGATLEQGDDGRSSMLWLVGAYLLISLGELAFAPTTMALISRLAPARLLGVLMGGWYITASIGSWIGGQLGALAETQSAATVFLTIACAAGASAILLYLLIGRLVRWLSTSPSSADDTALRTA